jgi:hypothetical protein
MYITSKKAFYFVTSPFKSCRIFIYHVVDNNAVRFHSWYSLWTNQHSWARNIFFSRDSFFSQIFGFCPWLKSLEYVFRIIFCLEYECVFQKFCRIYTRKSSKAHSKLLVQRQIGWMWQQSQDLSFQNNNIVAVSQPRTT